MSDGLCLVIGENNIYANPETIGPVILGCSCFEYSNSFFSVAIFVLCKKANMLAEFVGDMTRIWWQLSYNIMSCLDGIIQY